MSLSVKRAAHLAYEHLLCVIHTEMCRRPSGGTVRVLDAGCGNGELLAYLAGNLPELHPSFSLELFGFDVDDHGVQSAGFFRDTLENLSAQFPTVPWRERIVCISSRDKWPFPDSFFDIIVTNQVLEHVHDHTLFFQELARVLRTEGWSVNLFPFESCFFEGHLRLPLAHRIQDHALRLAFIKVLSRLGFGKYRRCHRSTGISLRDYAEAHADYLAFLTNYLRRKEAYRLAKFNKLRISLRYSQEFYRRKFQYLLGLHPSFIYRGRRNPWFDWLQGSFLQYLSCITMILEKEDVYEKNMR